MEGIEIAGAIVFRLALTNLCCWLQLVAMYMKCTVVIFEAVDSSAVKGCRHVE